MAVLLRPVDARRRPGARPHHRLLRRRHRIARSCCSRSGRCPTCRPAAGSLAGHPMFVVRAPGAGHRDHRATASRCATSPPPTTCACSNASPIEGYPIDEAKDVAARRRCSPTRCSTPTSPSASAWSTASPSRARPRSTPTASSTSASPPRSTPAAGAGVWSALVWARVNQAPDQPVGRVHQRRLAPGLREDGLPADDALHPVRPTSRHLTTPAPGKLGRPTEREQACNSG